MGIFMIFKKQKSKNTIKYNKEIFLSNVKYMIKYGEEPEISLYDNNGKEYFIVAYQNFIDYYNADNNYIT